MTQDQKNKIPQKRLKSGFEPVWRDDFDLVKIMGVRPWFLRLYLQSLMDRTTFTCRISELSIQKNFAWNPKTIRSSLRKLIELGYIVPAGYLIYKIRPFSRFDFSTDSGKSTDSVKNTDSGEKPELLGKNYRTDSVKTTEELGKNDRPLISRQTNVDRHTDSSNFSPENHPPKPVLYDSELTDLRTLYPYPDREGLKTHLINRGFIEFEIGKILERVYPKEYT